MAISCSQHTAYKGLCECSTDCDASLLLGNLGSGSYLSHTLSFTTLSLPFLVIQREVSSYRGVLERTAWHSAGMESDRFCVW